MATQSEDVIPRPAPQTGGADSEDDDETTADYPSFPSTTPGMPLLDPFSLPSKPDDVPEYLAGLGPSTKPVGSALPKRGLKDFEPHPTQLQASTLETSRQAMYDALTHLRMHNARTRVVGVFDERTGITKVRRRKGAWLGSVGRDVAGGGVELRWEEALWALERGSLDVRFRVEAYSREVCESADIEGISGSAAEREYDADGEEQGLPMSLQAAYATLIAPLGHVPGGGLTREEYVVYGGLKRSGFTVVRARGTDHWKSAYRHRLHADSKAVSETAVAGGFFRQLSKLLSTGGSRVDAYEAQSRQGPLVKPGLYRSYQDIFRVIAERSDTVEEPTSIDESRIDAGSTSPFTTTWHVYKPNPSRPFKKSDPGPPDFSICVINARTTGLPTLAELQSLLNEQPVDKPADATPEQRKKRGLGPTYGALKHGHRNVLLGIVDEGIVSYMRVADAMFAQEGRLYDRDGYTTVGGPGSKKSGGRNRNKPKKR